MKAVKIAAALIAFLAAAATHADDRSLLGLQAGGEHLNNGSSNWRESVLQFSQALAPRHQFDLSLTHAERFGLRDERLDAAYVRPLSDKLTATLDVGLSPTHRVLAHDTLGASVQYEFASAWLLHAGARTTGYDEARVNQGLVMLERYVSSFSFAVGWRPARAFGTTAHSGEVRASYYYGERNSAGIIFAAGKEAASVASGVVLDDVRSVTLVGRHWFTPNWALSYSLGHTSQGDLYGRNGVALGVQHAF